MHTATMKAVGGSKLLVSHIEYLIGLFECDIVIRVPRADDAHSEEGSRGLGQGGDLVRGKHSLIIYIEVCIIGEIRRRDSAGCGMNICSREE